MSHPLAGLVHLLDFLKIIGITGGPKDYKNVFHPAVEWKGHAQFGSNCYTGGLRTSRMCCIYLGMGWQNCGKKATYLEVKYHSTSHSMNILKC